MSKELLFSSLRRAKLPRRGVPGALCDWPLATGPREYLGQLYINSLNVQTIKGGSDMKINPPKKITWWIALALGAIGLVANLVTIPVLSGLAFWLVLAGLVLLVLANVLTGL
jgi:hypothetical protein